MFKWNKTNGSFKGKWKINWNLYDNWKYFYYRQHFTIFISIKLETLIIDFFDINVLMIITYLECLMGLHGIFEGSTGFIKGPKSCLHANKDC